MVLSGAPWALVRVINEHLTTSVVAEPAPTTVTGPVHGIAVIFALLTAASQDVTALVVLYIS